MRDILFTANTAISKSYKQILPIRRPEHDACGNTWNGERGRTMILVQQLSGGNVPDVEVPFLAYDYLLIVCIKERVCRVMYSR